MVSSSPTNPGALGTNPMSLLTLLALVKLDISVKCPHLDPMVHGPEIVVGLRLSVVSGRTGAGSEKWV